MKIAHVVMDFKPIVSGDGTVVYEISKYLSSCNYNVTIITFLPLNYLRYIKREEYIENIKIVRFPYFSTGLKLKLYDPIIKGFFSHLINNRYDIIHCHSFHYYYSLICVVYKIINPKCKLILHMHHPWQYSHLYFLNNFYKTIRNMHTRFILSSSDIIIAITPHDIHGLKNLKLCTKNVVIIPNGINWLNYQKENILYLRKKYNIPLNNKIIFYLGMLAENKGLLFLLKTFHEIVKKNNSIKLVISGRNAGMKSKLVNYIKEKKMENDVFITGILTDEEKIYAFLDCDIFILPSKYEGFGIVLIEAQAAGKPVIATKKGGIPYVVLDKETGFLIDYGNVNELVKVIKKLVYDDDLRNFMGLKGREYAKNYDYMKLLPNLLKIYKK